MSGIKDFKDTPVLPQHIEVWPNNKKWEVLTSPIKPVVDKLFFAAMDHRSNGCIRDGLLRLSVSSVSSVSVSSVSSSVTPFSGLSSYSRLLLFGYVISKYNSL